jgi:YggT family protein
MIGVLATSLGVLATFREDLADYVYAVFVVYTLLIIAYILSSLFFAFGGRVPYSRGFNAVLGFLRDVCEPYLSIFRRFIPPLGPLDLSPVIAIFVLQIVGRVIANLIAG